MSTPSTAQGTVQIPAAGTYRVDPEHSTISFTTKHMFGLGTVKGTFGVLSGEIVATEPLTGSSLVATADATSFASAQAQRDDQVKSAKFLDVETHPQISFRSTAVRQTDAGWVVDGTLVAKGAEAPLELAVTELVTDGNELTVRGTAKVDRYAHGVTAMKGMAARWLTLDVAARATRV